MFKYLPFTNKMGVSVSRSIVELQESEEPYDIDADFRTFFKNPSMELYSLIRNYDDYFMNKYGAGYQLYLYGIYSKYGLGENVPDMSLLFKRLLNRNNYYLTGDLQLLNCLYYATGSYKVRKMISFRQTRFNRRLNK